VRHSWIEQIREAVRQARYDMTAHATQEVAEDGLEIVDVEQAILTGFVKKIEWYVRQQVRPGMDSHSSG
jgi:hypothetical protein